MNWNLLHRYLTGECTPIQLQKVEAWLQADPHNREFMDSLDRIWAVEPKAGPPINARATWKHFERRIEKDDPVCSLRYGSIDRNSGYVRSTSYALAAAAVIIVAFLFFQQVSQDPSPSNSAPAMQEIITDRGQRTTVRLADGTRVQLNADSRLQIPGDYLKSRREVRLQGEAYFEVKPNPAKPFVVYTKGAYSKVLGTKFGVRSYPEDSQVQVVVSEGKVELGHSSVNASQITKNQMGILGAKTPPKVSRVRQLSEYLGWIKGRLVFNDTPLQQVQLQLERWYDIQIDLANSVLAGRRLTASFSSEPMTEVLNIVALSTDMSYTREGRAITFRDRKQ